MPDSKENTLIGPHNYVDRGEPRLSFGRDTKLSCPFEGILHVSGLIGLLLVQSRMVFLHAILHTTLARLTSHLALPVLWIRDAVPSLAAGSAQLRPSLPFLSLLGRAAYFSGRDSVAIPAPGKVKRPVNRVGHWACAMARSIVAGVLWVCVCWCFCR